MLFTRTAARIQHVALLRCAQPLAPAAAAFYCAGCWRARISKPQMLELLVVPATIQAGRSHPDLWLRNYAYLENRGCNYSVNTV